MARIEIPLKPPSWLWLPVSLMLSGAVFLLVARGEAASQILALILAGMAASLVRHWRKATATSLVLFEDGTWAHAPEGIAFRLADSSVRLGRTVWLNGRCEAGQRNALMLMPSMMSDEHHRQLCCWFEAARHRSDGDAE